MGREICGGASQHGNPDPPILTPRLPRPWYGRSRLGIVLGPLLGSPLAQRPDTSGTGAVRRQGILATVSLNSCAIKNLAERFFRNLRTPETELSKK